MEKPFLVCHMFVSMDGKIDGAFMSDPNAVPARTEYEKLRNFYDCTATIYGTTTMQGFADGLIGALPVASGLSREDYVAPHEGIALREFVLRPLSQIAPNLRHPVTKKTTMQMLAELEEEAKRA